MTFGITQEGKRKLVPNDRTGRPLVDQIFGQLPYLIIQTERYNEEHPKEKPLELNDITVSLKTTSENPIQEPLSGVNVVGVSATKSGADAIMLLKTGAEGIDVIEESTL